MGKGEGVNGDSKYHNAVFVGKDENGDAKHAHKRSTYTLGESYRGNVEGSDARCSFHHTGTSGRLYVFEAPIDMISFLTMYPDRWQRHSHVALCGVSPLHTKVHENDAKRAANNSNISYHDKQITQGRKQTDKRLTPGFILIPKKIQILTHKTN